MRTTVTLDPDVEALLRVAMRERGGSFKEVLNSAVRSGLMRATAKRSHFVQKAYRMGGDQNFRWDKALDAAGAMEDEELGRKFSLRK